MHECLKRDDHRERLVSKFVAAAHMYARGVLVHMAAGKGGIAPSREAGGSGDYNNKTDAHEEAKLQGAAISVCAPGTAALYRTEACHTFLTAGPHCRQVVHRKQRPTTNCS